MKSVEEAPILRKHDRQRNIKEQMECGEVDTAHWEAQMELGSKSQACRDVPALEIQTIIHERYNQSIGPTKMVTAYYK
jgi:hypothetical protein